MPRRDDHFHPEPSRPGESLETAVGGAGDFGPHGGQQASPPAITGEHRPAGPDQVPGDAGSDRRHGVDPRYAGPERRLARR